MVKIVVTRNSYLKDLVDVGRQHWDEKWLDIKFLRNTLRKKGLHFTAIDGKRPVGNIMVAGLDYPRFWIFYFAVAKSHQRRGIGTMLLKKVESRMKKGVFLFVDLERRDKTGINFYRKNGFNVMGRVNNWFDGKKQCIIMAKKV